MKITLWAKQFFQNFSQGTVRFGYAILSFLVTMVFANMAVYQSETYEKEILTFLLLGMLYVSSQLASELFFSDNRRIKALFYVLSTLFTIGYYFYIKNNGLSEYSFMVRTGILLFIIAVSWILIPSLPKDSRSFSAHLMLYVKQFSTTFLFSLVLTLGLYAILGAFNFLITSIDYRIYSTVAVTIIFGFFPLFFLSSIPMFPTSNHSIEETAYLQAIRVPAFFKILLSYIVIPIILAYTLILILYIVQNLMGSFWSQSLLESLLVSYLIIGWLTLFLIENFDNRLVSFFKKYFAYLLLFITFLQGASSSLQVKHDGLTDTRYFVILFVIFSVFSSLIYLFKKEKINWIPLFLIFLAFLSIVPVIDAVSLGTRSQRAQLEKNLIAAQMLKDNEILPNENLAQASKKKIIANMDYLNKVEAFEQISFLPKHFSYYNNFKTVFGFDPYYYEQNEEENKGPKGIYVMAKQNYSLPIDISKGQVLIPLEVSRGAFYLIEDETTFSFNYQNKSYELLWQEKKPHQAHLILKQENQILGDFDLNLLNTSFEKVDLYGVPLELERKDLTFEQLFDKVTMTLFLNRLYIEPGVEIEANFYLMLDFN